MLIGKNLFNACTVTQHIGAQSVSGATVNGTAILEPWKTARQLIFLFNLGDVGASGTGDVAFEQRLRADGSTWSAINNDDGNALVIADMDDATAFEDATVMATIDTSRIDSVLYDGVRATFTAAVAAIVMSCDVIHFDLHSKPSGQVDQIFSLLDGVADA